MCHVISDVLPNDRYFALEQRCATLQKTMHEKSQLLKDTIENEGRIPKDVLLALRTQGFYGLNGEVEFGGEALSVTETTRLLEELASIDLSLSETVAGPLTLGYSAIQIFGNDDQVSFPGSNLGLYKMLENCHKFILYIKSCSIRKGIRMLH